MQGPGQVVSHMNPPKFGVLYILHCSVVDVDRVVCGPFLSKVNHQFLGFLNVHDQVIVVAPVCDEFHLLRVVYFIIVLDEAHYCCIICILNNVIGAKFCTAVIKVYSRGLRTHP